MVGILYKLQFQSGLIFIPPRIKFSKCRTSVTDRKFAQKVNAGFPNGNDGQKKDMLIWSLGRRTGHALEDIRLCEENGPFGL